MRALPPIPLFLRTTPPPWCRSLPFAPPAACAPCLPFVGGQGDVWRAFSLVELLVAVAVIGVLSAIVIPALGHARTRGNDVRCLSNMRQMGTAMLMYAGEHQGKFPRVYEDGEGGDMTWMTKLAPYVGMDHDSIGASPLPRSAGIFVCPAHDPKRIARRNVSYAVNRVLKRAPWNYERDAPQLPAQTFLVVEIDSNSETGGDQTEGRYIVPRHGEGDKANFIFADGHVESIEQAASIAHTDQRWWRY